MTSIVYLSISRDFLNISKSSKIGLNYMAAMLSPEGLKTFVFAHRNSFPNISTRGSGYEIIVYGQYAAARIRPISKKNIRIFFCQGLAWFL